MSKQVQAIRIAVVVGALFLTYRTPIALALVWIGIAALFNGWLTVRFRDDDQ